METMAREGSRADTKSAEWLEQEQRCRDARCKLIGEAGCILTLDASILDESKLLRLAEPCSKAVRRLPERQTFAEEPYNYEI